MEKFWSQFELLVENVWYGIFQTWTIYQALIIAAAFVLSWVIAKRVEPSLEAWIRGLKLNAGFLRLLAALLRRAIRGENRAALGLAPDDSTPGSTTQNETHHHAD